MASELTTQKVSMSTGGSDDFDVSPPAGTPDVDSQSKDDIAGLLRQSNEQGGAPTAAPSVEPGQDPLDQLPPADPAVPQPSDKSDTRTSEEIKADEKAAEKQANIFKKFGIPPELQTNPAIMKMATGYGETETYASQNSMAKSQAEKLTVENEQLLGMAENFQQEINQLKSEPAPIQASDPNAPMTDREIEDYNANPKAAIAKAVQDALKPIQQKNANQQVVNEQDQVMAFKVSTAINQFKTDKKFDGLEADADKILKENYMEYDPRSVHTAYHAARSVRLPEIVAEAKNAAFSEGFKKAMDEVKRGVDGGRSTVPAEGTGALGGFTEEQLSKMPASEIAKLIPNSGV